MLGHYPVGKILEGLSTIVERDVEDRLARSGRWHGDRTQS